jgi:hypothetical protein
MAAVSQLPRPITCPTARSAAGRSRAVLRCLPVIPTRDSAIRRAMAVKFVVVSSGGTRPVDVEHAGVVAQSGVGSVLDGGADEAADDLLRGVAGDVFSGQ